MEMVGRADQDEIERAISKKGFDGFVRRASGDTGFVQDGKSHRLRIDYARDLESPADFRARLQHMRDALPETDDTEAGKRCSREAFSR